MNHPELANYHRLDPADDARKRIDAHLEGCAACRDTVAAFSRIDSALAPTRSRAEVPQELLAKVTGYDRRLRSFHRALLLLTLVQIVGGVAVLAVFGRTDPLVAGLVGGVLLGDSGLVLAVGLWTRARREALREATGDWQSLRRLWASHLEGHLRSRRALAFPAWVCLGFGTLELGHHLLTGHALSLALGLCMFPLGIVLLVAGARQTRRSKAELASLDALFPAD